MNSLETNCLEQIKLAFNSNPKLSRIVIDEELTKLKQNIDRNMKYNSDTENENNKIQNEITKLEKKMLQNKYRMNQTNYYIENYKEKINRLQTDNLNENDYKLLYYEFLKID